MDVECVFFKRRAGHYFPIPVEYALASLSLFLCGFSRGRKMKFSREEAGEKVGSRRNVTRATIN